MIWIGMLLVGCSADCDEGFGKANDGNCYPIEDTEGDDDDGGENPFRPRPDPDTARDTARRGDTGRRSADRTAPPPSAGGIVVERLPQLLTCGSRGVQVTVDVADEVSYGTLDSVFTGADEMAWSESHGLDAARFALWGHPHTELQSPWLRPSPRGAADVGATALGCDAVAVTHALRVYDLDGALRDCVVWGPEPERLLYDAGPVAGVMGAVDELDACVVLP